MPYIQYEDYNPKPETLALIQWADRTARDYQARGFELTLRQLYYQGVTQNLYPNSERSYKNLGSAITKGRYAGLFDWALLTDRTRNAGGTGWAGQELPEASGLVERAAYGMVHDLWAGQQRRVEVWVEKQALEQVAQRAVSGYRVPFLACKGYMSASEMWEAGYRRFQDYFDQGQDVLIIHLGDHDPSGIDMSRDVEERLQQFAEGPIELRRIALNMDQIEQYGPPPNPAKLTDSRAKDYITTYGRSSWELDALQPELLIYLIRQNILSEIDSDLWNDRMQEEKEAQAQMRRVAKHWDELVEKIENDGEDEG